MPFKSLGLKCPATLKYSSFNNIKTEDFNSYTVHLLCCKGLAQKYIIIRIARYFDSFTAIKE